MPQPGGSANINGILYQILGTLEWASRIQLSDANRAGEEITQARLIMEPSGGGGDTRLHASDRRRVGQWKTKGDGGPWSLQRVIDDVIPDLYRAVDQHRLDDNSEYLFITEGKRGKWDSAYTFFQHLSRGMPPPEPLTALDGETPYRFFRQRSCTQREFFQTIADAIRQHAQWCNEPEQLTYRKLWHLLARFQLEERCTATSLRQRINDVLYHFVNDVDEIDDKRQQLYGILLELAAKGNATITPEDLLRKAGLNPLSFRQWSLVQARLRRYLDDELHWKGYQREFDVRPSLLRPDSSSVLVVMGESGQGKTWRLARLALDVSLGEGLVAFITASGDADQDRSAVADVLWKEALDRDQSLTIDRIVQRRRQSVPEVAEPWATVCIDDVQTMAHARQLLDTNWEAWGIRLAMTVPLVVGRALKSQNSERVHVVEVGDFTSEELRNYLQCRHRNWGAIPQDVRQVLRRPLLASLYCKLAGDPGWAPTSEYELFERYWQRIQTARDQADFLEDAERMRGLAAKVLQQDVSYPWDRSALQETDITPEATKRLESIGWLRRVADNQFEIRHDRLLNWAVAESLIERRQANKISTEDLSAWLVKFQSSEKKFAGKSLGYVPLDLLWLVSDPQRRLLADVPYLIAALEGNQTSGGHPESLYRDLLPTLGERVIPALIERLRTTAGQEFSQHVQLVSTALVRIGSKTPEAVQTCGVKLLNDPLPELQRTGMRVLARIPSAAALDRLWELHRLHVQRKHEQQGLKEKDSEPYWLYDLSFSALRACTRLQPQWLVQKIYDVDSQSEPVWELAYLMANLEDPSAKELWTEVKSILFENVPPDRPRSLINCIRRFRDYDEIPRLEQWLKEKSDFASASALAALAVFDPARTLACLKEIPRGELSFVRLFRSWWLPELLLRRREETQTKLRALLQELEADPWEIAEFYQGQENEMDAATVDHFLDALEREFARHFDKETGEVTPRLSSWLELLARLTRAELLKRLQSKAGSKLEALLTTLACSRVGRAGSYFDHDLHSARLLLLKIGGSGITTLVNCELIHSDFYAYLNGLTWALVKPDAETRQLLRAITESDQLEGTPPAPHKQLLATRALAALHESEAVVESVLRWGLQTPDDLIDWCEGQAPISDERLQKAIEALDSTDERVKTNALLVLGISGRKDFVPRIRQILSVAEGESKLALAAMIALDELGDKSSETVRLFTLQLQVPKRNVRAVNALLRIGTDEALKNLEHYLCVIHCSDFQQFHKIGAELALALLKHPLTQQVALRVLWPTIRDKWWISWPHACFEAVGDLDDQEVQDWLREEAFPTDGSLRDANRIASMIRGLAKFDPVIAFQAARLALRQVQCDRAAIPDLLLELGSDEAILVLCDHAPAERHALTRWAIGRALRYAEKKDPVLENLKGMLQSSDPRVRGVGAELAGWQNCGHLQEMLHKLCIDDMSDRVRRVSREALLRQRDEEEVYRLMNAFRSADSDQQWSLLEAIIETGDPYLLGNKTGPLWIGQILDNAEIPLVKHAKGRLEERIKEMRSQAEKIDRDMEREA
jgi:HEAT repeat protein